MISLYITNTINAINAANPIKCTIPSFSGAIRFFLTASIKRNTRRPPSSAGIGSRFITPKLAEIKIPRFIILKITADHPDGAAAS